MNEHKALRILRKHNRWRRYDGEGQSPKPVSPELIGEAIDAACRVMVEHREAMKVLRQIAEGDNRTRRKKLAKACVEFLDAMREQV